MVSNERPASEKRWSWWGQFRDAVALIVGVGLLCIEAARGTYNPIAMTFAAVCLGIVSSGILGRFLIGRWENQK